MSTILNRIGLGVLLVFGLGFIAWGFATIYFLPQPEFVPELSGTTAGLVREIPNGLFGLYEIFFGAIVVYAAGIFRYWKNPSPDSPGQGPKLIA